MGAPDTERPSAPPSDELIGKVLSGKYVVHKVIGRGGMGTVYECENRSIGRMVAVKILAEGWNKRPEIAGRFQREARAAARIGHPNIVDVLDMGQTEAGQPYIVMERLEGEDLAALMARHSPLPQAVAVDLLGQVLGALGAAHAAGIVHRDMKPENVFLARRGPRTDFVKVLDFGVAKFHDADAESSPRLTREGSILGTPAYMSPEQALQRRETDLRSDLYSIGVMLYEMLSGRLPHEGETNNEYLIAVATADPAPIREVAPQVPERLAAVVHRALARDPAARFQTAAEFLMALEPFGDATGLELLSLRRSGEQASVRLPVERPTIDDSVDLPGSGAARVGLRKVLAGLAAALVVVAAVIGGVVLLARPALTEERAPAQRPHQEAQVSATGTGTIPAGQLPAAPPMISLDVVADVAGAEVSLDGVLLGVTPLHAVVAARQGMHRVEVRATGRETAAREIPLVAPLQLEIVLPAPDGGPPSAPPRIRRPGKHDPQKTPALIYDDDVYHR